MSNLDQKRGLDFFDCGAEYAETPVTIIGAGGIGSFAASALAKLGLGFTIYDGDVVEPHNVPNQNHQIAQIGKNKAEAIKDSLALFSDVAVEAVPTMWLPSMPLRGIVIGAVDSMKVRREIWEAISMNIGVPLFIDGRIGGELIRIIQMRPVNDYNLYTWYDKQLFSDKDAAPLPCTGKAIIDVGYMIGALITRMVRGFLKDKLIFRDTVMSMTDLSILHMQV